MNRINRNSDVGGGDIATTTIKTTTSSYKSTPKDNNIVHLDIVYGDRKNKNISSVRSVVKKLNTNTNMPTNKCSITKIN